MAILTQDILLSKHLCTMHKAREKQKPLVDTK